MYKNFTCPFLTASSVVPPYDVFPQLAFFLVVVDLLMKLEKVENTREYGVCNMAYAVLARR